MDRYLVSGALVLFLLQVTWLLDDLKIIHVPLFHQGKVENKTKPIGVVIDTKRNVKRRGLGSLVWQSSLPSDTLYFYDSVLTLKQSVAKLKVEGDTEINLSENTLVVLEPSTNKDVDRLRLIFSKGDMRAKSQKKESVIETSSWTVETKKGSSVNVRSKNDGKMEVELLGGQAKLVSSKTGQAKSISKGQVVELSENKVEKIQELTEKIEWEGKDTTRVYSHTFPTQIKLSWKGPAQQLVLSPQGKAEEVFEVAGKNQFSTSLDPGLYFARLKSKDQVSLTMRVQVWKAPIVHLLSPLPRDRVENKEKTVFSWAGVEAVNEYVLQVYDVQNQLATQERTSKAKVGAEIAREGGYKWRVLGLDSDHFVIPPLYHNEIYFVNDPLAAPKLKPVKTRRPASKNKGKKKKRRKIKGAWNLLYQLFVTEASAQPKSPNVDVQWEAVFEWEQVGQADHYMVEISKSPSFKNPVVIQKVTSPTFVWEKAELGTYYWRVAAGKKDKMGLFSQPEKVLLSEDLLTQDDVSRVTLRKVVTAKEIIQKPKPDTKEEASIKPRPRPKRPKLPVMAVEEKEKPPENPDPKMKSLLWWGGGFQWHDVYGYDDTRVRAFDTSWLDAGLSIELPVNSRRSLLVNGRYHNSQWNPDPSSSFPFQSQMKRNDIDVSVYRTTYKQNFAPGIAVSYRGVLKREGLETIRYENQFFYGLGFQYNWASGNPFIVTSEVSAVTDFDIYELHIRNSILKPFELFGDFGLIVGVQVNGVFSLVPQAPMGFLGQGLIVGGVQW